MNIIDENQAIEQTLAIYSQKLDTISDEYFKQSPPGGGWSFAEVYSHVLKATLGCTVTIEKCSNNNVAATNKGATFFGWYVMLLGVFPPIKVKVPAAIAAKIPAEKMSIEEAKLMIDKCKKRLGTVLPLLGNASPDSKIKHPRLGMLNAQQWFKFTRIHAQHHLAQLDRIERKIKKF